MTNISGVRSPFFSVLTIKNYALRFYAALDYCMRVMYNINQVNNGERSSGMGTVFLGYTTKDVTHATKDDISAAFGEEYAASLMKNDASARSDSLCGAALLLSMLGRAGITPCGDTAIKRNENGKPYFPALPKHGFSIAHSGGTAVCVLSDCGSVGIDIEFASLPETDKKKAARDHLAARWLAPRGINTDGTLQGFLAGWTEFEAASKYLGKRLTDSAVAPPGTVTDKFIIENAERVGVISVCRPSDSTLCILPELAAAGAVPLLPQKINIAGVDFDPVTLETAVMLAEHAMHRGSGNVMTVFTPNPVISMSCRSDPELLEIINSASLSLPDGRGVIDAAKRLSKPLHERVAGIDFGYALLGCAAKSGYGVFLLGGRPGVAEKAAERLRDQLPGLRICGVLDGFGSAADERRTADMISRSGAVLLIVCLGSPRQEKWIYSHRQLLDASGIKVAAALGGALDVWSGDVRRAPGPFIRLRLEWLWRCIREPRRLRVIPTLVRYRILTRKHR